MTIPPPTVGLAEDYVDENIMRVILASHFFLKKRIELFGKGAEKSATKEVQDIHGISRYKPQDALALSKQEKRDALESLVCFAEDKDGRIKRRTCAMGNKQCTHNGYGKSARGSPTVTTGGLILTAAIDTHDTKKL